MSFFNLYRHDFIRLAVAVPTVSLGNPGENARQTIALLREASSRKAALVVFPELGLTGYSCDDLFHQEALLAAGLEALSAVLEASREIGAIGVVGMPLRVDGLLYNCAVPIHRGSILGVVPKTFLPNYREFYELRQFTPGATCNRPAIDLLGQRDVPFGSELLFEVAEQPLFRFHVEICEDLWTPIPPSSFAALAGATVLLNLSASNVTVGKDDYRRSLGANQSARCLAAYAYSAAGAGESTTDMAWDGHGFIYENGALLAETERFAARAQLITADVDLERLAQDRMRQTSFGESVRCHRTVVDRFRHVRFSSALPIGGVCRLERTYERFPFVPANPATRDQRCQEIYETQVQGLVTRLRSMGARKLVIGISGGLDSTQALIVCARAMGVMGLPRSAILAYTMPGFATSERTLNQAHRLMKAVGVTGAQIDIRPSCMQMLKDIGHGYARGEPLHDVTFENVQAGERTSHLFRLANLHAAPVVGTGDLSELALGWCTYGVGDHMSHYNVNASVPKTLIQYLIRYVVRTGQLGDEADQVLLDVLETEISPELVPGESNGQPTHSTEAIVGPYELQDFSLYYILRFGYSPRKVAFLAWSAWADRSKGRWPDVPEHERHEYSIAEIKRWLKVFLKRFFEQSQYKRSAIPNAPKVGSGGSLSPRSDWRAPSDGTATVWLADLETVPEREC